MCRDLFRRGLWMVSLGLVLILSGCSPIATVKGTARWAVQGLQKPLVHLTQSNFLAPDSHVQHIRMYSDSLSKYVYVDVYLPPGYDAANVSPSGQKSHKSYPVLYLFHGKDGNQNSWMSTFVRYNSIHIDETATNLIQRGKLPPLIIVSPAIDNSYGINTAAATHAVGDYNRGRYADFITKDLVQYIDTHYHAIRSRDGRYIGGYSMGGFAALSAAFTHPNLYSRVAVMSAALWVGGLPGELSWIYETPEEQAQRDPITIAEHSKRIPVPVLVIEGDSDPFYSADIALFRVLKNQGAAVQLHTYPGAHDFTFWRSHASEFLSFFK